MAKATSRSKSHTPIQTNFTSGIFSARLRGRTDLSKYFNAVKDVYNMNLSPQGGGTKRSGTRYIATVKNSAHNTRLVRFVFSTVQAYILEFGDQYTRFYKDEGQILSGSSPYEISTPYLHTQIFDLKFAQSADILYICHPLHQPRELTRTGHTSWSLNTFDYEDGPYQSLNTTATTLTPSGTTGSVTVTASAVTGINGGDGFLSTDVGRWIRIKHSSTWGAAKITARSSTTQVTAAVKDSFPFGATTAQSTWRLGAWCDTTGWPSAQPTFFDERLCLANSSEEPNAFWISRTDDFVTFSPTDPDGTVGASHGIRRILADNQVNAIHWLVSEEVLLAGTSDGPYAIRATTTADPFGPDNIESKKQNRNGVAAVDVLEANDSTIYVGRSGLKLREISFDFEKDKRVSTDITLLSSDIFEDSGVKQMSYAEDPDSVIYSVLNNGSLIRTTFERDQEVVAWHRNLIGGTNALVKSVATIPSISGKTDTTYCIISRTVDGSTVQYVEFFEEDYKATSLTNHDDAFFVDSGLTYSGSATTSVSGLGHLEGETVRVLVDGASHPNLTVNSGSITLANNKSGSKIHAGLPYKCRLETLNLEVALADGSSQGRTKRIDHVTLRVFESIGGKVGPDDSNLDVIPTRSAGDPMDSPPPLKTRDIRVPLSSGSDQEAVIVVEQDLALPFTLLAIMPQVQIQDR